MRIIYKFNAGLLALSMFLIISLSGNTQTVYDVIPTGGTAGTTNGSGGDPVCDFYESIRYQVVYTAAELTAAGIQPNTIFTNLAWNVTELPGTLSTYSVRIGHTAATNSAAHDASPTTEVKAPFNFVPVLGYNDIPFDVDFTWDGVQNLLIEICTGPANPFGSPYGGVQAKTGIASGARFIRADGAGMQCGVNTNTAVTTKPYVRLTGFVPPAVPPTPTQALGVPSCSTGSDIDVVGSPAVDVLWYWQTTSNGTSTSEPYTGPYTVFANGFYYLRAFHTVDMIWSVTSSQIEITNFPVAAMPPMPTADANPACVTNGATLTVAAAPVGNEYYWQGTNEFGTSTLDNASSPYLVSTSGTYYVRALETASQCWSNSVGIAVVINSYIPEAPTTSQAQIFGCTSASPVVLMNATAPSSGTVVLDFGTPFSIAAGTTASINQTLTLPAGAVVTSAILSFTSVTTTSATYPSDVSVGLTGAVTLPSQVVAPVYSSVTNAGPYNLNPTVVGNGTVTMNLVHNYSFGGPLTASSVLLTINYTLPASTIEWFDASTGGASVGTGSPLNAIGTTVMPTDGVSGDFDFFAASFSGGCYSATTTQVTVSLSPVNVQLIPSSVTCNNGNDGTFALGAVTCGTAPFTYSLDGGATFAAIPTDLTVGDHSVIVKDAFDQLSGTYTVTVGDAPAPSALVINDFTNDIVDFSWTGNGTETQWYVEWGLAGFTPGTGNEVGSTVVSLPTHLVTGLDGYTDYDFYVAANCGIGTTAGTWISISQLTLCDPILAQGFCETFDSSSPTEACWTVKNENGDIDSWDMNYTFNTYSGDQAAIILTDFNAGVNNDWLISPMMTLTNNEILSFFYRVQSAGEPNDFELLLSTTGMDPADFTNVLMANASYSNIAYADTIIDLAAYSGDCYIAVHVPNGGLDGWRLYIDQFCIDICTPDAGTDGTTDACRLDNSLDLNTVITQGETNGVWEFNANPGIVSGSDLNLGLLPDGTYDFEYIVTTACTMDTTVATVTVHPASSAGNDGTIDDNCTNWSSINLTDGLSGTLDLGGSWTNVSGEGDLAGSLWTPSETTVAGSYDFHYVVSNGFCPNDTSVVTVTLISCLGVDGNETVHISVYPNPVTDVLTIQNLSIETGVIEVLDVQGKVVSAVQVNGVYGNYALDMNNVQRGMYIVRITTETSIQEVRVVKH